jgi:hypothetical protein
MPEHAPRQSSSPFLRKLGPMPVWAWMAVGLGVALAFSLYQKNKKAASQASQASSAAGGATTPSGTPSNLIPQFVNQVFQSPTPPPQVTVNNTTNTPPPTSPPPKTPPPRPQAPSLPAPSDFEAWKNSSSSIHLHWGALSEFYGNPNASYTWVVKDAQGNSKTGTTKGTDVDVSGLKPHTGYSIGVYATGDSTHQNGAPTYSYIET